MGYVDSLYGNVSEENIMTNEEIYEALENEVINPLDYLTDKEYNLDLKTFRKLVFHDWIYNKYKWHQYITGTQNLLEFSLVGQTFRVKE